MQNSQTLKHLLAMDSHEAIARATWIAGASDDGWNTRFLEALKAMGYQLLPIKPRRFDDVMAPIPYHLGEKYPYPSIVVKGRPENTDA